MAHAAESLDQQLKRISLPTTGEADLLAVARRAEMVAEVLFAITDFLKRSAKGLMRALRLRAKNGTKKHLPLRGA
jgi:hypothetical protein